MVGDVNWIYLAQSRESVGSCEHGNDPLCPIKIANSWPTEGLAATKGLQSMQLVGLTKQWHYSPLPRGYESLEVSCRVHIMWPSNKWRKKKLTTKNLNAIIVDYRCKRMQHLKNEQYMHTQHTLINRRHEGLWKKRWRPTLMKKEQACNGLYPVSDYNCPIMFNHWHIWSVTSIIFLEEEFFHSYLHQQL